MVLSRSQAKSFYDRFGIKQDSQAFYEDAALEDMIAHAAFETAESVFELGCGTGRLALTLLSKYLPSSATYFCSDLSQTMVNIAQQRISPYSKRAKISRSNGSMNFSIPSVSVDRVVSTYVLDLLSEKDIREAIDDAHRVLVPRGKLCLVSLTAGVTLGSRVVSSVWSAVFRVHAPLVGGCRPIQLASFFDQQKWSIEYRNVVTQFGVSSEVLIASPNRTQQGVQSGRT
ncbi:MAG: class I SAM-dependent methyltransferase [Proteobacteria bacterium]|jgi:ubiquinone/menaquinone biosynthesis C-methylase UbiE|nr:class I SAM-dependent methyltransferase [Pseudomonadota bacterium]